jgi:proline iminopeptidase
MVGASKRPPLIVIHGGPGLSHQYLANLEAQAKDRPVLFYDQLGCGKSDHPHDASLWTLERSCEELDALRNALGIHSCYLYGHSFGSVVATEYLLDGAKGVKGMILAGPALNLPRMYNDINDMRGQMSIADSVALEKGTISGDLSQPAYNEALQRFHTLHFCMTEPIPADLQQSLTDANSDVIKTFVGPCDFKLEGRLQNYDATPRLRQLHTPVLLMCGDKDLATPSTVETYHRAIKGSRMIILAGTSHCGNLEMPKEYNALISSYLLGLDKRH